jgi:hypothetical protein
MFGGAATTGLSAEDSVAKILRREIGDDPTNKPVPFAFYEHHWADSRERPGEYRQDRIIAWRVDVHEEEIARITLDPNEYEVGAGLMRFDGSQEGLRPISTGSVP